LAAYVVLGLAAWLAFFQAATGADGPTFDLRFDEPVGRAVETVRWPVTAGVPFANGAIRTDTPVTLSDAEGMPIPVQTQVLGQWRVGPRTPKWILLDFQANIASRPPATLRVVAGRKPVAPAARVKVLETPKAITVDTGAVTFSVSRESFGLFDTFALADGTRVLKGSACYWIAQDGRRYEAKSFPAASVEVEMAGPMRAVIRAEGWYAPVGGGQELMRYQIRIAAFAGLPYVRIYHTLIWTTDDSVAMKEFGLSFGHAHKASRAIVGRSGGNALDFHLGTVEAVQQKHNSGFLIVDGLKRPVDQFSGYIESGGPNVRLAVSLRDMTMQLPKAFRATPDELIVQLWAAQTGPMSMKAQDRIAPMHLDNWKKNHAQWHPNVKVISPQGVARTHEIWVWPVTPESPASEAVNDLIQRPVIACADPEYQGSTDAVSGLRAARKTPKKDQYVEDALEAMFQHVTHRVEEFGDFDMWHFGDVHLFSNYGWRTWDCGGYNWPAIPWMMFYRTGDRRYYEEGVRNARHVMDVDCCHHAPLKAPAHAKGLGFMHSYSTLHWLWGPCWDQFWTHPEFLESMYYMTGYERAADVLAMLAKSAQENLNVPNSDDWLRRKAVVSRTQYGQIQPKAVYYEFTGDPELLRRSRGWADLALAARNKDGTFANNNFWGFFYTGIEHVTELTGEPRYRESLLGLVKDFNKPVLDPVNAPAWDRRNMIVFAAAHRATDDPVYLRYPIWRIRRQATLTNRKTNKLEWTGGLGYSSLARLAYPVFMEGAMQCLGAWHDAGFPEFPGWPRNNPSFASHGVSEDKFRTGITVFVKKDAGRAGTLLLTFKSSNLSDMEGFKGHTLGARITGPDGKTRTVPIEPQPGTWAGKPVVYGPQPVPIEFAAQDPAGEYRVDVLSTQPIFWLNPRSTLPGMVIWLPEAELKYKFFMDPAEIHFRLRPGVTKVTLKKIGGGGRIGYARPAVLLDPDGKELRFYGVYDPPFIDVPIPKAMRGKTLSILKSPMDYGVFNTVLEGLAIEGAWEYFAVNQDQWFLPSTTRGFPLH